MLARMTPQRAEVLAMVALDRVTWRYAGRGLSYKVWASADGNERVYETRTPLVAWLVDQGYVRRQVGFRFGAGTVEMTRMGWERLVGPATLALTRWW